jgi:hypothetical protein
MGDCLTSMLFQSQWYAQRDGVARELCAICTYTNYWAPAGYQDTEALAQQALFKLSVARRDTEL